MKTAEQISGVLKIVMKENSDFNIMNERVLKLIQNLNIEFSPRISNISFYEGLVQLRKNSRKAIKTIKRSFLNSDVDFNRIIQSLNDLSSQQLRELYKEYKSEKENEKILLLLQIFIKKKEAIEWLAKFRKDKSIFISFKAKRVIFKRNFRFFFRKILSTHFKNLDDYHSYSIL